MSFKKIMHELKEHSPFTFFATLVAILIVLIINSLITKTIPEGAFHIMHPLHVFVSALVSAALFYKYKRNLIQSLIVGISVSLVIGSISDVLIPWLGAKTFGFQTEFHLPLIEETFLILSTAIIGSILGIILKISKEPHFLHVFLSVFASLFYLTSFSQGLGYFQFLLMILIVFIAVLIPCCFSDIILPVLLSKKREPKKKDKKQKKKK